MAEYKDREHFIPLRKTELIDLLCADKDLAPSDADQFRQFCQLVSAIFHFEFNQRLEELKAAYAPFDPDTDTISLVKLPAEERQRRLNDLFSDFGWLLERANFTHLSQEEIEPSLTGHGEWGLPMQVDFGAFERLAIFARGDTMLKLTRRRLLNLYRLEEIKVPGYRRLVLILKLKPDRRHSDRVNTDSVYLKVFKDIPKLDIKVLLPSARVRLTKLDTSKIGLPLLSGLGLALWKIITEVFQAGVQVFERVLGFGGNPTLMLWGMATGAAGYGYKSYYGYQQTKQRYHLNLTQSLYYQNLDSNAGVLFRLLDEAEEQDCREAFLAYFFLWRFAGDAGWTTRNLDDYVELHLERYADLKVDFEIGDALDKLEKLRVVEKVEDRYRAVPIARALEGLDWKWDNYFKYHNPEPEKPPTS
jgi:hypothetical protein